MSLIDIKAVKEEARKEVMEEAQGRAKELYKRKLLEIENAHKVMANLERELEELELELGQS